MRQTSAVARFCRLLDEAGLLAATELALPGQTRRIEELFAAREAVPAGVNQRVGTAKREKDGRIAKTAADMIVPFERFGEMMDVYRRGFESRQLDFAIWGHISDGNVHPNVIPHDFDDVLKGREAILEFGREVARLGGCPLAEHGVAAVPSNRRCSANSTETTASIRCGPSNRRWTRTGSSRRALSVPGNASDFGQASAISTNVPFRVCIEARLAGVGAEAVRLPLILALRHRILFSDHHPADWISTIDGSFAGLADLPRATSSYIIITCPFATSSRTGLFSSRLRRARMVPVPRP